MKAALSRLVDYLTVLAIAGGVIIIGSLTMYADWRLEHTMICR